ncbi:hypothetical protein [Bradyrhizobium sp. STM 3561]|uniref:hypothetical protein n=1 Tax=Bradyrhizobium sp. STM 3561 TaxID=578923 RepID=UPI00388E7155
MLALTLCWRMRRSVKKRLINVATLQAGFMASPPTPIETPRRFFHQVEVARGIPVGLTQAGVAEVSGANWELLLDVLAFAIAVDLPPKKWTGLSCF